MSSEKRPADEPAGQLVVKRPNLGERALTRANASGSGALVQSVCSIYGKLDIWRLMDIDTPNKWPPGPGDGTVWALRRDLLRQV